MGVGLLRAYPQLDYVVSGYGEEPLLLLARGARPSEKLLKSYRTPQLDQLPLVDYSAFLDQFAEFGEAKLWLCFESSRGCWWGMKNHCTFCGLNGAEMKFFEKSSERVVDEVRTLWQRHKRDLFATDTIMPRKHLAKVLPELATQTEKPGLFYEVKVNMSAADLALLGRANVKAVQPGIESLSTHLLSLMKKGVTTIQNLALLKYCREQGIAVGWNQLCGIPGETLADYHEQIALMAKIPQLPPPETVNPVRLDRYSPYFKAYVAYGWQRIEPLAEYRGLHPQLSESELLEIAYHFNGVGGVTTDAYLEPLSAAVDTWNQRFRNGEGFFVHPENGLVRNEAVGATSLKGGAVLERVLECTHEINLLPRVVEHAGCKVEALQSLVEQGLLFIEAGKVVNLAVRVGMKGL
jgi:ribosomal peptide maturation radical SAM protein 1